MQALGSFEGPLCLPGRAFPQESLETPEPDACVHRDFGLDFGWKAESDSCRSRYLLKQLCSIFWIVLFLGEGNESVIDGALLRTVVL